MLMQAIVAIALMSMAATGISRLMLHQAKTMQATQIVSDKQSTRRYLQSFADCKAKTCSSEVRDSQNSVIVPASGRTFGTIHVHAECKTGNELYVYAKRTGSDELTNLLPGDIPLCKH